MRDKDAVNGSMLICEMAAFYKSAGTSLPDRLQELYQIYGYYRNDLMDFVFEGAAGMEKMASIMESLRNNPPAEVIGKAVTKRVDYKNDNTGLPKSDVLEYNLEDGSGFIVRPSGTEPKLKIYLSAKGETAQDSDAVIAAMKQELPQLMQ